MKILRGRLTLDNLRAFGLFFFIDQYLLVLDAWRSLRFPQIHDVVTYNSNGVFILVEDSSFHYDRMLCKES